MFAIFDDVNSPKNETKLVNILTGGDRGHSNKHFSIFLNSNFSFTIFHLQFLQVALYFTPKQKGHDTVSEGRLFSGFFVCFLQGSCLQ